MNDPCAAGLGGNSNQFTVIIAYYISLDYSIRQIHEILKRYYNYNKAYTTFIYDFNSHFISIQNARKLFLRPILISLVKDGFKRNDIIEAYGKNMDHRFKELFSGRLFSELKNIKNRDEFESEDYKSRGYFDTLLQKSLHPEYYFKEYISFLNDELYYSSFDWIKLGKELIAAYIIDRLKSINPYTNLISKYTEITLELKHKKINESLSLELFNDFKVKNLYNWLINHPTIATIHDFNDVYNYEKKNLPSYKEIIPLGVLKEKIILKYNNLNIASNTNGLFSDNITIKSFFYYYDDWDTARQEVCGPIVIQMLRRGENVLNILNLIGENDQSIIMKWFFKLDVSSINNILDYYKNIKTIKDFYGVYLNL